MMTLRFATTLARLAMAASVVAIVGCSRRGPSSLPTPTGTESSTVTPPATAALPTPPAKLMASPYPTRSLTSTPSAVLSTDTVLEAGEIDQQLSALQQAIEAMDPLSDVPTPGP